MSEHHATISWQRTSDTFDYDAYNRAHEWSFEGGVTVPASAAPGFRGTPERVDPEEAYVAALSSCHMLTFLAIAAKKRLVVDGYEDAAVGWLEKNDAGQLAITRVVLKPRVVFGGEDAPADEELARMHDKAHHGCFLANSVRTEITVEPMEVLVMGPPWSWDREESQDGDGEEHHPRQVTPPGRPRRDDRGRQEGRRHGEDGAAPEGLGVADRGQHEDRSQSPEGEGGQVPGEAQRAAGEPVAAEQLRQVRPAEEPAQDVALAEDRVGHAEEEGEPGGGDQGVGGHLELTRCDLGSLAS